MPAFWLTYKPFGPSSRRGWPASELSALVERFESSPANTTALWRVRSHKAAKQGDRFFLFQQGEGLRGIFGAGRLIEKPQQQPDPTDIEGDDTYRAAIKFDQLVDPKREFLLEWNEIEDLVSDTLSNTQTSGISVEADVADEIDRRLAQRISLGSKIRSDEADDRGFDPDSVSDLRDRAIRAIRVRRGQQAFRAQLLAAYGGRCVITGCKVKDLLEAAHITPYLGRVTNHTSNGLLMRSDLHTLFDCGLLAIDPETRKVVVSSKLKASSYSKIDGVKLRDPLQLSDSPSTNNLRKRFKLFRAEGQ